jgi:DNA-binding MarR family transcriptional regulator
MDDVRVTEVAADTADTDLEQRDFVDGQVQRWAAVLPQLDLRVEAIVERIYALSKYLQRSQEQTLAGHGITWGEWRTLGSLRKTGEPYRRSPGALAKVEGLSSGAMTNRLDRLEERGLVRRLPDPSDRRALQVELTEAGLELWMKVLGEQAEKEALIASSLDRAEQDQLNALLRRLTLEFERDEAFMAHLHHAKKKVVDEP